MSDRRRRWWAALIAVALLVTGGYGVVMKARSDPPKPRTGAAPRAISVVTAAAITRDVGVYRAGTVSYLNVITTQTIALGNEVTGKDSTMSGLPGARLQRVTEFIDHNLARALPLAELSAEAHMSQFHFARLFKESTGLPPHRFVVKRRIERACALLLEGHVSIDAIARAVGFRTRSHFSMVFHRFTGSPPTVYRAFASVRRNGDVHGQNGEDRQTV